ncbi:MAG: hemerythrin domain-containing protein [Anaeromyxobacter sp.]
MNRVDVYGLAHKALRALLFETAALAARTDFADAGEAARLAAAAEALLGWLDEHAEHEERQIMPELLAISPELHAALAADHGRVASVQQEVRAWVARLRLSEGAARVAAGARLHDRLLALTADQLRHMASEEADANRALWAHRTDDELRGVLARIRAATSPERGQAWLELLLPALSAPERASVLAATRK